MMPAARMTALAAAVGGTEFGLKSRLRHRDWTRRAEAEVRLAVLAELAARVVFGDRDWPW